MSEANVFYADTDLAVTKVVEALDRAADRGEPAGLDTEFYGVDLRAKSCVAESKLHLLSVAVFRHPTKIHPRGFTVADSAVLGRAALDHAGFRRWLAREDAVKAVHNAPVDVHTLNNEGVEVHGWRNTLAMSRWAWPDRARAAGFTLDALGRDFCGTGKTETFSEIFTEEIQVEVKKERKIKVCACGDIPKRGHPRSTTFGHARLERLETTSVWKTEHRDVPLQQVTPGHLLWERVLRYAAQDAVLALAVYELAVREMRRQTREVPWLAV